MASAATTAPDRAAERTRIKRALFVPDPLPSLVLESYGEFEAASDIIGERVSYATDYGLRVPAIVYRPKKLPDRRMPGIVVVNGHGGDKYTWYAWYAGILYARAGAVVLTYDPIGEGERNLEHKDGTRQHDIAIDPPEMGQRMDGLMITDLMQAVSYLITRPDTDAQRIGAVGYSMGSFVLGLACALDTRLHACVLAGGGNFDGPGGYWDSSGKVMCQAIPYKALQFLGDRGALLYDLHADHAATLVINGTRDDVVAEPESPKVFFQALRKRTIALAGSRPTIFEVAWIEGGGHRPYFLTRPGAIWLQKHLLFPNWSVASIGQMPETHISEWASRNHVVIEKSFNTESREAGTRALGADILPVPHDAMNALPIDLWNRVKDRYVYESWVREAKDRCTGGAPAARY